MSDPMTSDELTNAVASVIHNPESSTSSVQAPKWEEEEEGDLNKALGVQHFQQILSPTSKVPGEQHRTYNEEDFEYHRHSSHHIHHPLSKLTGDCRRKKRRRSSSKDYGGISSPITALPIEEVDDEEDEAMESLSATPVSTKDTERKDNAQFFVFDNPHVSTPEHSHPHAARSLLIIPSSAECGVESQDSTPTDNWTPVLRTPFSLSSTSYFRDQQDICLSLDLHHLLSTSLILCY